MSSPSEGYLNIQTQATTGNTMRYTKSPGRATAIADDTALIGKNPEFASGAAITAAVVENVYSLQHVVRVCQN